MPLDLPPKTDFVVIASRIDDPHYDDPYNPLNKPSVGLDVYRMVGKELKQPNYYLSKVQLATLANS